MRKEEEHQRESIEDLRTEKTRAIFPTARILFRMTSLRIAEEPPETSPACKLRHRTPLSVVTTAVYKLC